MEQLPCATKPREGNQRGGIVYYPPQLPRDVRLDFC